MQRWALLSTASKPSRGTPRAALGIVTPESIGKGDHFLAIVIVALWIGSAVAGWLLFWPWLAIPVAVIGLHIMRLMNRMSAARRRNGLPDPPIGGLGSMAKANTGLLAVTFIQHLAIFAAAASLHWLLS